MKSKNSLVVITCVLAIITFNFSQAQNPRPKRETSPLRQSSVFSGKLTKWVSNQDFVYNGFYMESGTEKYLVKFTPHLGHQLTSALKVGSALTINAIAPDSSDKNTLQLINIATNGMNIYDSPPTLIAMVPAEEFIFGSSKITELQENKQGEISGYILSDKTILRLPPNATEQLTKVAVVGAFVSYSGSQILRNGEFAPEKYTIVRCSTITIDEKQYLIN